MPSLKEKYGGSDRPHHLKLNADVTKDVKKASRLASGGIVLGGIILGYSVATIAIWTLSVAILCPLFCRLQEQWASPDCDLQENRGKGFRKYANYWYPYGAVVKHRSFRSHSAVGTVIRFVYGFWPMLALLALPMGVWVPILGSALFGAAQSDIAHYALDGYGPVAMLMGKRKPSRSR